MVSLQITDISVLIAFWLVFTRFISVIFQLPIFDNASVPSILKVLFSLVLTFAFFPHVKADVLSDIHHFGKESFWYLTIMYTIVGLAMGFLIKSVLLIYLSSGTLISQQIGFSAVRFFDPTFNETIGPIEKIIQWTIIMLVITSGALLPMFKGMVNSLHSLTIVKVEQLHLNPDIMMDFFKSIFSSSILLASPLIFTNLFINLVLGIVSRTVPQMNVLMVSFIINIGLGLLVFFTISTEFFHVGYKLYVEKLGEWFQLFS